MKYVTKPIVVEAFRFGYDNYPDWFLYNFYSNMENGESFLIKTSEGVSMVCKGDFIIKGIKGEVYSCKEEIFKATYEPKTK